MSTTDQPIGLPRNYLRACILLLLSEAPSHGYELLDGMRGLGLDRADPGGLYRALRALEQEDLVISWWEESPSGPARRSYALTEAGQAALVTLAAMVADVLSGLQAYLNRYEQLTAPAVSEPRG